MPVSGGFDPSLQGWSRSVVYTNLSMLTGILNLPQESRQVDKKMNVNECAV